MQAKRLPIVDAQENLSIVDHLTVPQLRKRSTKAQGKVATTLTTVKNAEKLEIKIPAGDESNADTTTCTKSSAVAAKPQRRRGNSKSLKNAAQD